MTRNRIILVLVVLVALGLVYIFRTRGQAGTGKDLKRSKEKGKNLEIDLGYCQTDLARNKQLARKAKLTQQAEYQANIAACDKNLRTQINGRNDDRKLALQILDGMQEKIEQLEQQPAQIQQQQPIQQQYDPFYDPWGFGPGGGRIEEIDFFEFDPGYPAGGGGGGGYAPVQVSEPSTIPFEGVEEPLYFAPEDPFENLFDPIPLPEEAEEPVIIDPSLVEDPIPERPKTKPTTRKSITIFPQSNKIVLQNKGLISLSELRKYIANNADRYLYVLYYATGYNKYNWDTIIAEIKRAGGFYNRSRQNKYDVIIRIVNGTLKLDGATTNLATIKKYISNIPYQFRYVVNFGPNYSKSNYNAITSHLNKLNSYWARSRASTNDASPEYTHSFDCDCEDCVNNDEGHGYKANYNNYTGLTRDEDFVDISHYIEGVERDHEGVERDQDHSGIGRTFDQDHEGIGRTFDHNYRRGY